jgi:hypothetical protein
MKLAHCLLLSTSLAVFAAEEQTNRTFNVQPGGTVVVDVDFGSIDVTTQALNQVDVEVWRKVTRKSEAEETKFLRDNPIQFIQDGNTVTIRCRSKSKNLWNGWSKNRNEGKYTVRVPAQFGARLGTAGGGISVSDLAGEVKADTSGGGLRFARVHGPLKGGTSGGGIRVTECEGDIRIDTSGGGIDVTGGGGLLKADTSGGGITVRTFRGPATVRTSGGGLTLESVGGKVKGSTSGGPINAVLESPLPGDVNLSTSGGGVTVQTQGNAAFNLDAETSGGSVTCDLPVAVQGKIERGRLKGPVNGGGPVVSLRSSGGGIHVKKL